MTSDKLALALENLLDAYKRHVSGFALPFEQSILREEIAANVLKEYRSQPEHVCFQCGGTGIISGSISGAYSCPACQPPAHLEANADKLTAPTPPDTMKDKT
jgi:hypothetical protein